MSLKTGCTARQYSDQMLCDKCGLQWDMNDDDLPQCSPLNVAQNHAHQSKPKPVSKAQARGFLSELKKSLE